MYNYTTTGIDSGMLMFILPFYVVLIVLMLVSSWKVYTKAGQPGWAALVPIYNVYILLRIVGRPSWWLLLYIIPLVNIVVVLLVAIDLAKSFGRSTVFGVLGLFLFPFIGHPILAFGDSQYIGPAAGASGATAVTSTPAV